MSTIRELTIEALGSHGEGVAAEGDGKVYVPFTLPGERVTAEVEGERGTLIEVLAPSPERILPVCRHFGTCGGCALQHASPAVYRAFKRNLIVQALKSRGFGDDVSVGDVQSVPLRSRRRASFGAVRTGRGVLVGYHRARTHTILEIEDCPLLRPALSGALPQLHQLMDLLLPRHGDASVHVTEAVEGLDISVSGDVAELDASKRAVLGAWLTRNRGIVRLTVDGEQIAARTSPTITLSRHTATLPPASFLQAVAEAEATLLAHIRTALGKLKAKDRIADLFAGLGAFTLPLAERHELLAVEWDRDAVASLTAAARQPGLRKIEVLRRDLFREPLSARELKPFAAVVFDPPRAGAEAQATELAASAVPSIIAVSCNPATFARDARLLVDGGYRLQGVAPVDQFLYAPHVELVASFTRPR